VREGSPERNAQTENKVQVFRLHAAETHWIANAVSREVPVEPSRRNLPGVAKNELVTWGMI